MFNNPALVHDNDSVATFQTAQTMGHTNDSVFLKFGRNDTLHQFIGMPVDAGRNLIQDQKS